MANNKINTVHYDNYKREFDKMNGLILQPMPAAVDPRLWEFGTYSICTHLNSVQSYSSTVKSRLQNFPISDPTSLQTFEELCTIALSNSYLIGNYWANRRAKLGYALNASIFWSHWNNNVREFFLTGLVKDKRDKFINVVFGDEQASISDHSYLNGLFQGTTNDMLYKGDGNSEKTSTGEAANAKVKSALDKAREKVREITDVCKTNITNCEVTYNAISGHLDHHNQVDQVFVSLRTSINSIKSQRSITFANTQQDVEGGPGS